MGLFESIKNTENKAEGAVDAGVQASRNLLAETFDQVKLPGSMGKKQDSELPQSLDLSTDNLYSGGFQAPALRSLGYTESTDRESDGSVENKKAFYLPGLVDYTYESQFDGQDGSKHSEHKHKTLFGAEKETKVFDKDDDGNTKYERHHNVLGMNAANKTEKHNDGSSSKEESWSTPGGLIRQERWQTTDADQSKTEHKHINVLGFGVSETTSRDANGNETRHEKAIETPFYRKRDTTTEEEFDS